MSFLPMLFLNFIFITIVISLLFLSSMCLSADIGNNQTYNASTKHLYRSPVEIEKIKAKIGKKLFHDRILSNQMTHSCSSCHNPKTAYSDGLVTPFGNKNKQLKRNTPTLYNISENVVFFWDGRAETLVDATISPILDENEMDMQPALIENRINQVAEYKTLFAKAYNTQLITFEQLVDALVAFQKTITSKNSPFDNYLKGDTKAISESAKHGYHLFKNKAKCINCHDGENFTDNGFYNIGIKSADLGRGNIDQSEYSLHSFKVPTLRNISLTQPYMHNGMFNTLREVIEFYNRGGDVSYPNTSDDITKLNLSNEEITQLIEFLHTLSELN